MSRKKINKTEYGLDVIDINSKGLGVAKSKKGVVYFIKNTVPGDRVDIHAYKKEKDILKQSQLNGLKGLLKEQNLLVNILAYVEAVNCNILVTTDN